MKVQGKVWGKTSELFNKNNVEIHRVEGDKGGFCSKHKHEHKHNIFFIESGKLQIDIWKNDYDLKDVTVIGPGQTTHIKPGEYHQFRVLEVCVALEIYYVELDSDDIIRETVGGISA